MVTTTDKVSYGTSTAITCTLAGLASSATAGRMSASVDNTTNLYVDAMLYLAVKTSGATLANDKACYVYLYGSEDGTNYSGSTQEGTAGTDSAVTFDNPTNLKGSYVISCISGNQTFKLVIGSVASAFGGVMPRKWGFALQNYTGQPLSVTEGDHTKTYTGVYYTNS